MQILRILLSGATVVVLSGCANTDSSVPPIWPMAEPRTDIPDYIKDGGGCPSENNNPLGCARADVQALTNSYFGEEQQIASFKNGGVLSLFGLGTAAGINTIQKGSKNQLQRLGIAAGAIVGFNDAFGSDGQHAIYDAGVTALECVMRTDAAVDQVSKQLGIPTQTLKAEDVLSLANRTDANLTLLRMPTDKLFDPSHPIEETAMEGRTYGSLLDATLSAQVFSHDIRSLSQNPDARAKSLIAARDDINQAVENALYKNGDITTIYSKMATDLKNSVGPAAGAGQATQGNSATAAPQVSMTMRLFDINTMSVFAAAQLNNTVVGDTSRPLTDAYEGCIALAATKPPTPPPGKGK